MLARPPDQLAPYDYAALELNGAELQVAAWPWSYALLDELIERSRPDLGGRQHRAIARIVRVPASVFFAPPHRDGDVGRQRLDR